LPRNGVEHFLHLMRVVLVHHEVAAVEDVQGSCG
jgi:hypothetical protein